MPTSMPSGMEINRGNLRLLDVHFFNTTSCGRCGKQVELKVLDPCTDSI
jgi:hypothetical protein